MAAVHVASSIVDNDAVQARLAEAQQLPRNYYELFGVDSSATTSAVRQAYRHLCTLQPATVVLSSPQTNSFVTGNRLSSRCLAVGLQWHPDRHREPSIAAAIVTAFHHIQSAYDTLSNPELRAQYNTHGHARRARQTRSAKPIDTGNELFQVEREATTYQASLSLLQRLTVLEQQYHLETGSLELQVAGSHLAACDAADSTCVLFVVDNHLDSGGLNACLCSTHARLHQCNQHCTSKLTYCPLFAQCIHRHWLSDVQSAWSVQVSETTDPERPAHPYWFNPQIGKSAWKTETDTRPPEFNVQQHTCTAGTCSFKYLLGRLWVCRESCALHVCTPTQCQQRQPLNAQSPDNIDNFDTYCWITGQIYAGGEHADCHLDGLTPAEATALAAAEQLDPGCGSSGAEARLVVSRRVEGKGRRYRGERAEVGSSTQSLLSPRETSSQASPSHSAGGDTSPVHESSLAYIAQLTAAKRQQSRRQQDEEAARIQQLKAERQDDDVPDEDGLDDGLDVWARDPPTEAEHSTGKRTAAIDAECNIRSKRAKRLGDERVWLEEHPSTATSTIRALRMSMLATDLYRLHNLVAPAPGRQTSGKEAESFYGEYVTAVLDQPDHDKVGGVLADACDGTPP
jgi:DnaJ-domain-containing protein 1